MFLFSELKEREVRINFWHICKDLQKKRETGHKTAWQNSSCACSDWQRSGSGSWVPGHCWRTGSKNQMSYGRKFSLIYAWRQTHTTLSLLPTHLSSCFSKLSFCVFSRPHTSPVMPQHSGNTPEVSEARFPAPATSLFPSRSVDHIMSPPARRAKSGDWGSCHKDGVRSRAPSPPAGPNPRVLLLTRKSKHNQPH